MITNYLQFLKSLLYIAFVMWGIQVVNFVINRRFWCHHKGLLGLSKRSFKRLYTWDYLIFGFAVFMIIFFLESYFLPIRIFISLQPNILLSIFFVFVVLTIIVHVYMRFWRKMYRKKYEFNLDLFNREIVENLENRNVLYVDQSEIDKKYNIAKEGKKEKGGFYESQKSTKGNANIAKEIDLGISRESISKAKIDYEIHEGIDLKIISCVRYYFNSTQLKIYHLATPSPLMESNEYKILDILDSLERIRTNNPEGIYNFEKFELSNYSRKILRKELEDYLFDAYLKSSFHENITGMVLVIGDFYIKIENNQLFLTAKVKLKDLSVSFSLKLLSTSILPQKLNAFNISSNQTIKLIVFGWAREVKRQIDEEIKLNDRDVEIIGPLSILE
jgi:hypothetical protein